MNHFHILGEVLLNTSSIYCRGGQSIGPRAGAVFWWPAEGCPNVKGCGPRKRATKVFFSKLKKLKELKIESNADQKTKQYFLLIYHFIKITRKYHFILYGWQIWTFWLIFMIISTLKTRDQICQPYRVTQLMKRLVFRFQKLVHFRYQS